MKEKRIWRNLEYHLDSFGVTSLFTGRGTKENERLISIPTYQSKYHQTVKIMGTAEGTQRGNKGVA
jgi:hypothetical protein